MFKSVLAIKVAFTLHPAVRTRPFLPSSITLITFPSECVSELGVPVNGFEKTNVQELRLMKENVQKCISNKLIVSAHDVSSGGLISTILEMCFGYELGASIDLSYISNSRTYNKLFAEGGKPHSRRGVSRQHSEADKNAG